MSQGDPPDPKKQASPPTNQAAGAQAPAPPQTGTPMGPDEVALLQRFREKFLPDTRMADLDSFAKWLFGLTATVTALGAGLSNAALSKLAGPGIVAYAIAVLLSGIGLAVATFALSIELPNANWQSLDNMFREMKIPLNAKRRLIRMAATLLALALIAAAAAPLLSLLPRPSPPLTKGLTYSILPGSVEMALTKGSLRPGTILRLMVSSVDGNKKEVLLAATAAIVTSKGEAEVHIPKSNVPADAASLKIVSEFEGDSGPKQETTEIILRQGSQPPQPAPK